jgi:hypothetical protein
VLAIAERLGGFEFLPSVGNAARTSRVRFPRRNPSEGGPKVKRLCAIAAVLVAAILTAGGTVRPAHADPSCTATYSSGSLESFIGGLSSGAVGCLPTGSYTLASSARFTNFHSNITLEHVPTTDGAATITTTYQVEIPAAVSGVTFNHLNFVSSAPSNEFSVFFVFGDYVAFNYVDVNGGHELNCINFGGNAGDVSTGSSISHSRIHACGNPAGHNGMGSGAFHAVYDESSTSLAIADSYLYDTSGYGFQAYGGTVTGTSIAYSIIDGNDTGTDSGTETYAGAVTLDGANVTTVKIDHSIISCTSPGSTPSPPNYTCGNSPPNTQILYSANLPLNSGDEIKNSCIYSPSDTEYPGHSGTDITLTNITRANPNFHNRFAGNFTLDPGTSCAGYGPR